MCVYVYTRERKRERERDDPWPRGVDVAADEEDDGITIGIYALRAGDRSVKRAEKERMTSEWAPRFVMA